MLVEEAKQLIHTYVAFLESITVLFKGLSSQ